MWIDVYPGVLLSSLPWWIAAPLVQLAVLVFGMALDETYVNRTTVLTGAIAVHIHGFVAGEVGLLVGLYADIGLLVGAYGVYAYVIDAYVGNAFRLVAFLLYSPLSVFLVILTAGPTLFGIEPLFVPALALAGYGNIQLREYLSPNDPYYFGPESEAAFESAVEAAAETDAGTGTSEHATADTNTDAATPTESDTGTAATASADGTESDPFTEARDDGGTDRPAGEPAAAADSSERGILPEFMRRL
ncbi:hypothetical protein [Natrinema versiforme]|uniref:Uncharacterized protein n=1 Tax=Natrinema versiforme JCM 10478 TaxID=1227496 RepID=L9XZ93_9EURY|nr:hypothetical protein [Natrinema versiforme]ELY67100.1 hypothetical protein C489_11570 [Natrinema versiforme JCM 10478]